MSLKKKKKSMFEKKSMAQPQENLAPTKLTSPKKYVIKLCGSYIDGLGRS